MNSMGLETELMIKKYVTSLWSGGWIIGCRSQSTRHPSQRWQMIVTTPFAGSHWTILRLPIRAAVSARRSWASPCLLPHTRLIVDQNKFVVAFPIEDSSMNPQ